MFSIIDNISPFVIIPYVMVALFVISYLAYLKYLIRKEIKRIPTAIYGVDVNNLKKNLQKKSMVYNFILIISIIEFVTNIVIETDLLITPTIEPEDSWINLSNFCRVEDIDLGISSTFFYCRTRVIALVVFSEIGILMALFYIILRRMYLKISYHKHIRKYIIYIVLQFVVKSVLVNFIQTYYSVYYCTCLSVWSTLLSTFLLLESSTPCLKVWEMQPAYIQRNLSTFRRNKLSGDFSYAQVATIILLLLFVIVALLSSIQVSLRLVTNCFLSYITSDYIPTMTLSDQVKELIEHITYDCRLAQMGVLFMWELMIIVIYLTFECWHHTYGGKEMQEV